MLNGQLRKYGHSRLADFALEEGVVHVNHGSYGAVPEAVSEAQARWRRELERNPSRFFRTRYAKLLRAAAGHVAGLLGGEGPDWVFAENATTAANTVIASLALAPGDEVLATDQIYGSVRKALLHHTARHGAALVQARIPVPVRAEQDLVAAVVERLTPRTRVVVIDHVASQSAVVFPVARIAEACRGAGVPVLVDGAHAPGMLSFDVPSLGVDWYCGNGHKWLGAPRGCGLLWVRREAQAALQPLVISQGHGLGYNAAFDWTGTRDPSAWLSVSAAIDYHRQCGGAALRQRNHALAVAAGWQLATAFGTELSAPAHLLGSMATIRLPGERVTEHQQTERLQIELEERFGVEASIVPLGRRPWLRVSAAIYNEINDFLIAGRKAARLVGRAFDA